MQANLKRYRASVLKAACEGRLAPQDPADEPADRLLARILAERRAKWEAEHPGKKYVEPAAPVTDGLPELPVGWCWASLCSRSASSTRGRAKHSTPRDVPLVQYLASSHQPYRNRLAKSISADEDIATADADLYRCRTGTC